MDVSPRFSEALPGLEYITRRYFGCPSEFRKSHDPMQPIVWEPIQALDPIPRVKACFISNISSENEEGLEFQFPESVEEIRFDGPISQFNFDQLVVPLVNLRFLDIHLSSLEYLEIDNTLIQLNHLECLEITSTNYTYLHATQADMEYVTSNAIALLGIYFPALSYLAISVPALYTAEEELTQAIINSLFRHKNTLKYLNLQSPYPVLEDANGSVLMDPATAKNFEEAVSNNNGSLDQITLLSFHYYAMYRTCSTEFWRHFLLHQEQLEYCQFWCDSEFKAASPKIIRNNQATLHTVALNNFNVSPGKDRTKRTINCLSFQNCVNLKVIFLKGTAIVPETSGQTDVPDFENFQLMPTSLEKVKIMNILMSLDDTRFIVMALNRLKSLHLENIGEELGLGMDFEDLNHLLEEDHIDEIQVVAGVNRGSCEVSPGDGGYKTMGKILFTRQTITWIRAVRNEQGFFEILDQAEVDPEDLLADDDDESNTTIAEQQHEVTDVQESADEDEYEAEEDEEAAQIPELQTAMMVTVQFQNPGPSAHLTRNRRNGNRRTMAQSIASSDFHETQSIVDRLVDADEANVLEFLN